MLEERQGELTDLTRAGEISQLALTNVRHHGVGHRRRRVDAPLGGQLHQSADDQAGEGVPVPRRVHRGAHEQPGGGDLLGILHRWQAGDAPAPRRSRAAL